MLIVIGVMFAGVLLGYCLRRRASGKLIQKAIILLIWLLLFVLGVEVGGNGQIMKGLHTLGMEAIVLMLGGTLGSVTAAWLLWKALNRKKGTQA